ncbi:hypothetical protein Kpol_237p2 [Vanderwaltozyma polyspora DSM 70294]|uniref:Large ribosomal subunit protein uL30m n=1 Tax=Vanderwaltozyma polyspora (strain ATCC 22028 / DSM 70294 / BCRC 21397 / CBS 2163 / NBRC 10782 / NRRL Y-8283 / UCD 57-17) TaxID=436907 RepID=A7TTJ9_VANPO|nr:uncharacterized protein Kpol_237p2 [Vanderwaltozyma polyspora DSM 70294]EDO14406.1 hypothetical protein Kpol_237p2 [Vanderwaltozyma polyspora DSM 70294]
MAFYKITLTRSLIGLPQATRNIVKTIGLGKRGSIVYREVTPSIAGSLAKVKELVSVELSDKMLTREEVNASRKSNPGFTVEKRVNV